MNLPARDPEVLLTYDGFVRALARTLVLDGHRADDVAQQAWMTALEHGPRNRRSVQAWLGSLVRNLAASVRRAESRRSRHEHAAARNEATPSTEEILEREAARRSVVRAVLGLEEPYRSTVLLRYFDNLAPRTIAQRLGVPVETVRTRSKRALEQLRARLDGEHGRGRRAWTAGLLQLATLPPAVPVTAPPWTAALQRAFIQGVILVSTQMKLAVTGALLLAASVTMWALGSWAGPDVPDAASRMDDARAAVAGGRSSAPTSELASQSITARRAESVPASRSAATDSFGSLLVRLVWADKSPAADVGARVYAWGGPEPSLQHLESVSGSDGRFEVAAVHAGRVTVTADRGGTASAVVELGQRAEITVEIPVGLAVTGTVVDSAERPVPGAEIWLADAFPNVMEQGRIVARAAVDGSFRIRDVESGRLVGARAPAFAPSMDQFLFGNPGGRVEVRIELSFPGGEVAGVVFAPGGKPVASGMVIVQVPMTLAYAMPLKGGAHAGPPATLRERIDRDGRFRVRGMPTGAVPIEVRHPGFAPWWGSVDVSAASCAFLAVRLAEGVTLAGTVRDAKGEPVSAAQVRVPAVKAVDSRMVFTDERGGFRLSGLAAGEIRAEADGERKGRAQRTFAAAAPGQELRWEVVLATGLPIRGRVLDAADAPLPGWSVVVLPADWPLAGAATMVTDAEGRFVVANCKDAPHRLEVRAPQGGPFASHSRQDVRPGGEEIVIRVPAEARPSAFIAGVVVDANEKPVCGAQLALIGGDRFDGPRTMTEERTGRIRIGPVPPGWYNLAINARGFGDVYFEHTVAAGETWDLGTIRLLPPGRLSATVRTVDGAIPPPRSVWLSFEMQGGGSRGRIFFAKGQGQIPVLSPGSYVLQIGGKGFSDDVISCEVRAGEDTKVEVVVRPGIVRSIRFDATNAGPGHQLDGLRFVVREASGKCIVDMGLAWISGTGPVNYDYTCLAPGEYRLEASTRSGARGSATFRVDAKDAAEPVIVELR